MNLNLNATLVVDVDRAIELGVAVPALSDVATMGSIRRDSRTIDGRNRRDGVVNDNVHGGVQVQVHVKVNVSSTAGREFRRRR